ncbi:MAG: cell division protein FtsZ [Rhodospirillales bacterium]|nr:cell division protein FtsZ [Rhodospirillales bacterium]
MSINLTVPSNSETPELKPRITVVGVGGAGGNAVNNMIQSGLEGVDFMVANSDAQALAHSHSDLRIQMGTQITRGLGAGSNPDVGRAAAEESLEDILANLQDANMVFITAGLGGGTGTGAAPVIARAARERDILTVGVVTKPFQFEGANRMKIAEAGLEELHQFVDTLLIIPNQNLFRVANEQTTFADAFKMADDVLYSGVRGVTDLMVMPGLINLDFADIRSVMSEMGKAMMGTGEAEGERRAVEAAEAAIANPLLDDTSMRGARGVLINITAGMDITLFEVDEAANRIRDEVDEDANIIFGSTFDEDLEGRIRVSVVATGIEAEAGARPQPIVRQVTDSYRPAQIEAATEEAAPAAQAARFPEAVAEPAAEQEEAFEPEPAGDETDTAAGGDGPAPFIPDAPVEAAPAVAEAATPDPIAAADQMNGRSADEAPAPKKKGPSLFERVTGVGRQERREPQPPAVAKAPQAPEPIPSPESAPVPEAVPQPAPQPAPVAQSVEPAPESSPETQHETQHETPVPTPPAEQPAQSASPANMLLGALDTGDGDKNPGDDDDLLDIPAFLRRQAN